ncbi:beta-fructofuranosidase, soluble isoenzyme I-like isoform X2 [Aristolochia californica]|uniref:beta-fructofuranosidase, soluble isoenzyme I-like isoform X2 n=1 Tax=Aristolochia californica TaxID=171875 RepID=UPI0035DC3533
MGSRPDSVRSDHDVEGTVPCSYEPLPSSDGAGFEAPVKRRFFGVFTGIVSAIGLFALLVVVFEGNDEPVEGRDGGGDGLVSGSDAWSRGVSEGVSEKSVRPFLGAVKQYDWTNDMLLWQRTAYHFQPEKNWMNGPLFYKEWYHLFYQYNPDSAVWGNITWGHAVSRDMVHWYHLPLAMIADRWYDINGVWTGSATFLVDGKLVMLYTGSTKESVQVQNLAVPKDENDPLLLDWDKYDGNPVLFPPPGIGSKDFRDPTTGWLAPDGTWRFSIGSRVNTTGLALVYKTKDFKTFELLEGVLHAVPGTGMWECVDFYPVSTSGKEGLDTSANGPGVKHVLKASLDDDKHDYYAIGTYDLEANSWTPDDPEIDVGIGIRYDYGKFYASKSFYDQNKKRRVLWGWTGETDSESNDIRKGWASLMTMPRIVLFDNKTGTHLLQWPAEEVDSLRQGVTDFNNVKVNPGLVIPLDVSTATQLDINAEFEVSKEALEEIMEADVGYNCSTSDGAAGRSKLGPFGLLVLADESRTEQTAVYFYIGKSTDGNLKTFICQDTLRSSRANDLIKRVYGSVVPVLDGEKFALRVLVDHSIVETFAQGGRTCITSRVYPTKAIYGAARVFLFNNATGTQITATSVKIWQMTSAFIRPYKFETQSA